MRRIFCCGLLLMLLVACGAQTTDEDLAGRVLFWHTLTAEDEQAALDDMLARFVDIYEDVEVVPRAIERDEMLARYRAAAPAGLGPNMVMGENEWVRELAEAGLIANLTPLGPRTDIYYTDAVSGMRYQEDLYGIPFAVRPVALYYNREMVETPAETLDDLLRQAEAGQRVAINTEFRRAFWGAQAFGGQLFDAEGRVVLDQGGFANWLRWLREAEQTAGVFLSRDDETLIDLFAQGRVAYIVGTPDMLASIEAASGVSNVGVVPLPSGPVGAAGPLLRVDALMLNPASSERQRAIALRLANFLTNAEQGGLLVRETNIVPANRQVRVDPVVYPTTAGFRTQVQTAVPIPSTAQMERVLELGDGLLSQVLEGVVSEAEATQMLTQQVNEAFGFEMAADTQPLADCGLSGELVVWHGLEAQAAETLAAINEQFSERCPDATIMLQQESQDDLLTAYLEDGARDDVLLGSDQWLTQLVADGAVQPTPLDRDELQAYLADALQQVSAGDTLYGVPMTLDLLGLYYNTNTLETAATTLQELRQQVVEGDVGLALSAGFDVSYYGYTAYGGELVEATAFEFELEPWVAWLDWLSEVGQADNVFVSSEEARLRQQFVGGATGDSSTGYYFGYPGAMAQFEEALGAENFAVATLPGGPGNARTALGVQALFVGSGARGDQLDLARGYMRFVTAAEQQTFLLEEARLLPANISVLPTEDDPMRPWFEQIEAAETLPPLPQLETLRTRGTEVFRQTAVGALDAREAAARLAEVLGYVVTYDENSNEFQPIPTIELPTAAATPTANNEPETTEEAGGDA